VNTKKEAGGSTVPTKHTARGRQKMRGAPQKSLTLRAWLPTILPILGSARSWVQLEPLKGQRGSFGRQPSLAPPPRGVSSWRAYYSVFPRRYVHLFLCFHTAWVLLLLHLEPFPGGEQLGDGRHKGYKVSRLMSPPFGYYMLF